MCEIALCDLFIGKTVSQLAEINPSTNIPVEVKAASQVSFIPMADVTESGHWIIRQTRPLASVLNGFTAFEEGDVLVAKITPCMENGKGAILTNLENGIGFGSTEFFVLRARTGASRRFLFYVSQSARFRKAAETYMIGSAGQQRVQRQFFDDFIIPELHFDEQEQIATILDTIDTTIRQTETIIGKLQQMKQGLLHDLLTRGIGANGELRPPMEEAPQLYKESPLGWIPKEWEIGPFGKLCFSSAFGPRFPSDAYDDNGPLATLRTTDMDDEGNISLATMPRAAIAPATFADHLLKEGDIVISRSGTCGVTGIFTKHDIPVVPGAFLIRFRLNDLQVNQFYRRYFNSSLGRPRLEQLAVGGVQKNIKGSDVLKLLVPVLPSDEAVKIAARIEAIEHSIHWNQEQLNKLMKKKSGLMDDLLTGRVRVTPLLNL